MGTEAHRIAAELHDGAMQEITLARLQLDLLGARLGSDPATATQLLQIGDVLGEASALLRDLMHALSADADVVHTSS